MVLPLPLANALIGILSGLTLWATATASAEPASAYAKPASAYAEPASAYAKPASASAEPSVASADHPATYIEHPVTDGGHVAGTVVLNGPAPAPKAYNLVTYPETVFCGRISTGQAWRLLEQVHVSSDGGLRHAVVMVEGVRRGKPFPTGPLTMEARDCQLTPPVMVVRNHQAIRIVNMDPIIHDIQIYEVAPFGSNVVLHRPLRVNPFHFEAEDGTHHHLPGVPLLDTIAFTKHRRVAYVECGIHEFMQTWGVAVTNPYYAVTDERGRFTIADIPEGIYTLVAWHPGMGGVLDMRAVVVAGDTLRVRFAFEKAVDRRMAHTTMTDAPHYGVGALDTFGERIAIHPTHEIQTPAPHRPTSPRAHDGRDVE